MLVATDNVFAATKINTFSVPLTELPSEQFKGPRLDIYELNQKIILVDFWASWCAPCVEAFKHYDSFVKKYGADKVVVIAINQDGDSKERDAFLKDNSYSFSHYADSKKKWSDLFEVKALPTLYIYGKNRKPLEFHRGFNSAKIQALDKLIEQQLAVP